eukprot:TRINITY_DN3278_c0_g1_i1.p1 TRINITY_DN3278_c0_g1~~TRINITY_DN3278_c0_g1_i1.p1  ORF type:complete len:218 (+),score=52.15 TRINITY_DN3278_c0_g1_i1:106-759(+)
MTELHRSVYSSPRRTSLPSSERTQNSPGRLSPMPRPVSPTPRTPRDFVFPAPPVPARFGGKPYVPEDTPPMPPLTTRICNIATMYATATLPFIPHPPSSPNAPRHAKLIIWSEEQVRELEEFRDIGRDSSNPEVKKTLTSLYDTHKEAYDEALKSGLLDSDPFGPRNRKTFNFPAKEASPVSKPATPKSPASRKKQASRIFCAFHPTHSSIHPTQGG